MRTAPTQETFGIQYPAVTEATSIKDSIRLQGITLEGTMFGSSNDSELIGVGHSPLGHPQLLSTDAPQNYLTTQGESHELNTTIMLRLLFDKDTNVIALELQSTPSELI